MNEDNLEQRLQQAQKLLDAAPGLMFVLGGDGVFLGCYGSDPLMLPPKDFVGKHFSDVLPPAVSAQLDAALKETQASGNPVTFDYELPFPEGPQAFEARLTSTKGDSDVIVLVRNVTQRVRTADRLEETSALLGAVAQAQSAYLEGRDPRDVFADLLDRFLELSSSEYGFIGEVHHDEDEQPYLLTYAITNIAWNDETKAFYEEHSKKGLEFRNLHSLFGSVLVTQKAVISNDPANDARRCGLPPGHPALRAFLGMPLFRGRTMIGMVGIANRPGGYDEAFYQRIKPFVDMCGSIIGALRADTERERYQSALTRSEAHLKAVVDSVSDGIIVFDERGVIQRLNPAMQRMFNCSTEDTIGKKLSLFMNASEGSTFDGELRRFVQRARSTLLDKPYEFVGVREDGKPVPIELRVSELGPEFPNSFVGILRDVTERKRIERLQTEFVSMVSHELRTPLTSIRGALGLIDGGVFGALSTEMRELVTMALGNSERLMRLIDDIIDIERIQSGQLSVRLARVDVSAVVKGAMDNALSIAEQHGVTLVNGATESMFVRSDPHRLAQVMANLISNAIKYSPRDGNVIISLTRTNGWVRLAVRDYGPGVPEQFRNRIFHRFAQADGSDKRLRGGTGLGLSIAKAIIEQLGGRIGFENVDTGGARFFFELEEIAPPEAVKR